MKYNCNAHHQHPDKIKKYFMAGIELCKFTHGLGLYIRILPERKRGVKSKNIKAQPMCKFAELYACHELFRF